LKLIVDEMLDIEKLRVGLLNNNTILIKEKEMKKSKAILDSAEINNYPVIDFLASYSHRKNFDDFSTFGIGISLPIYGVEDSKEERARAMLLSAHSLKEDTKTIINSEFDTTYFQMKSKYEIYHIIHDDAMPQINHMFDLINSSISTGGDLFKYIDILVQKLKLEQKSIAAIANYNRAEAKITALRGEI